MNSGQAIDLGETLRQLAARIPAQLPHIQTEEAAKTSLVLPFISALGYNVFDPREVTPELCADVGVKKGEKVDYAILRDGKPFMLFECKAASANLDEVHASQLYRYFSVTEARIGVLTNGTLYRFFADLDAPNKMDAKAFLEVHLLSLDDFQLSELKRFAKGTFNIESILTSAVDLKYTREIKRILGQEFAAPSEEIVRFFGSRVHSGRMTEKIKGQFTELTKRALQEFLSDRISDRLKLALAKEEAGTHKLPAAPEPQPSTAPGGAGSADATVTTEEELRAYFMVQAILAGTVSPKRVSLRDQKSYCAVLLDDNNRRPICRLWFNGGQKYVGLFDEAKVETRRPITELEEIYALEKELRATAARYVKAPEQG